jgi:hypothetical protein
MSKHYREREDDEAAIIIIGVFVAVAFVIFINAFI